LATCLRQNGIGIQSDGSGSGAQQAPHIYVLADGDVAESQDVAFDDGAGGQSGRGADNEIHIACLNTGAQNDGGADSGDECRPDSEDELVRGVDRRQQIERQGLTGADGGTRRNVIGTRGECLASQ